MNMENTIKIKDKRIEELENEIKILKEERNRFLTIAYNAICLWQFEEIYYYKDRICEELGCTEDEYDEIMEI